MLDELWTDLQQQLDARGLTIRRGVIQGATFITADSGHVKADTPRDDQARTRRSRDGTWAKKGKRSPFGYTLHTLIDREWQLIRRLATTTASLHDSRIDLLKSGEMVYRDKGHFSIKPAASMHGQYHASGSEEPSALLQRETTEPGDQPYTGPCRETLPVIKRYVGAGHVLVTIVARVHLATMFACFGYNLLHLCTIQRTIFHER